MRSSPDASLAPWPTRILRPWLVASAAGLSLGTFLLSFEPPDVEAGYLEQPPRAAANEFRPPPLPAPLPPAPAATGTEQFPAPVATAASATPSPPPVVLP